MLPLRYTLRWQVASALLLAVVLAGGLAPEVFPDIRLRDYALLDKWLHAVAFAVLATWFCGLYERRAYPRILAGLLAFGALIEVCQAMTPYRQAEWLDLAADGIGILAGVVLALAGAGGWALRAERILERVRETG